MFIGWLGILFLVLLAVNIPVCFALLIISTVYVFVKGVPLAALGHVLTTSTDSFILTAIPLFILAAYMMDKGDVSNRIIDFSRDLVGHLPGGLAHVNVVANMIVAGMSGSALADAGGIGVVAVKMMRRGGYDDEFTAAITASARACGTMMRRMAVHFCPALTVISLTTSRTNRSNSGSPGSTPAPRMLQLSESASMLKGMLL
ncbi:MAG: TRAP transporter large permease subunit, partial [Zetaproteobacteria bacterium]